MSNQYSQVSGLIYMQRWRKGNRDRVYQIMRKWRAKQDWPAKRREHKQRLVDSLGGVCVDCGYNGHLEALEFDHIGGKKGHRVRTARRRNNVG